MRSGHVLPRRSIIVLDLRPLCVLPFCVVPLSAGLLLLLRTPMPLLNRPAESLAASCTTTFRGGSRSLTSFHPSRKCTQIYRVSCTFLWYIILEWYFSDIFAVLSLGKRFGSYRLSTFSDFCIKISSYIFVDLKLKFYRRFSCNWSYVYFCVINSMFLLITRLSEAQSLYFKYLEIIGISTFWRSRYSVVKKLVSVLKIQHRINGTPCTYT